MRKNGNLHLLTKFIRNSLKYFEKEGFLILEGNDIETEYYNFDALNIPKNHPSRDMHDTFWIKGEKKVLRTHTTASEANIITKLIKEKKLTPPFRIIFPGKCYRNERTDLSHEHTFYQMDGIIVDKNINFRHLLGLLSSWMTYLYGNKIRVRINPSMFPFVEPGMELSIQLADGKWREMLGAGMAHPNVLKNMGINPNKWQGIMWGSGIDRYAMIKYNIDNIRNFHSQDLRFIKQFK